MVGTRQMGGGETARFEQRCRLHHCSNISKLSSHISEKSGSGTRAGGRNRKTTRRQSRDRNATHGPTHEQTERTAAPKLEEWQKSHPKFRRQAALWTDRARAQPTSGRRAVPPPPLMKECEEEARGLQLGVFGVFGVAFARGYTCWNEN